MTTLDLPRITAHLARGWLPPESQVRALYAAWVAQAAEVERRRAERPALLRLARAVARQRDAARGLRGPEPTNGDRAAWTAAIEEVAAALAAWEGNKCANQPE